MEIQGGEKMSRYIDVEDEVDLLESLLRHLEIAKTEALQTEYHQYMANSLELDIEEIQARLDELYEMQNEQWTKDMQQQNIEYEEMRL